MSQQANQAYKAMRGRVVLDLLNEYGDLPSRTLARMLAYQYPELFPDVEIARSSVRYYRGLNGEKNRRVLKASCYDKSV